MLLGGMLLTFTLYGKIRGTLFGRKLDFQLNNNIFIHSHSGATGAREVSPGGNSRKIKLVLALYLTVLEVKFIPYHRITLLAFFLSLKKYLPLTFVCIKKI